MNKTLQELINNRNELQEQVWANEVAIRAFDSGFWYAVIVHNYGSHRARYFTNYYAAEMLASEYNGDNGIAETFTNDSKYPHARYISSKEAFEKWREYVSLLNHKEWCKAEPKYMQEYWTPEYQQELEDMKGIEEPIYIHQDDVDDRMPDDEADR